MFLVDYHPKVYYAFKIELNIPTKISEILHHLKQGKYDVQVIREGESSEDVVEAVGPHLLAHLLQVLKSESDKSERRQSDFSPRRRC